MIGASRVAVSMAESIQEGRMQDAGFVIGRHVKVEIDEGRLIIERVD